MSLYVLHDLVMGMQIHVHTESLGPSAVRGGDFDGTHSSVTTWINAFGCGVMADSTIGVHIPHCGNHVQSDQRSIVLLFVSCRNAPFCCLESSLHHRYLVVSLGDWFINLLTDSAVVLFSRALCSSGRKMSYLYRTLISPWSVLCIRFQHTHRIYMYTYAVV